MPYKLLFTNNLSSNFRLQIIEKHPPQYICEYRTSNKKFRLLKPHLVDIHFMIRYFLPAIRYLRGLFSILIHNSKRLIQQ
jgi:hypothetical protein